MSNVDTNFAELEKKLASEANTNDYNLKKYIKDFHDSLSNEIERNRKNLFFEVKNTLTNFSEKLEKSVSQETETKVSNLFETHLQKTREEFKSKFEELSEPMLKKTEEDMQRLRIQGNNTLRSWEQMMNQYNGLWTKPFFVMFMSSAFTGTAICLTLFFLKTSLAAYLFMDVREKQAYENELYRIENTQRLRLENLQKYKRLQKQNTSPSKR